MKFYLIKNKLVRLRREMSIQGFNAYRSGTDYQRTAILPVQRVLELVPIMSEKQDGDFWDLETLKKCGEILTAAIKDAGSDSGNRICSSLVCRRREGIPPPKLNLTSKRAQDNELIFTVTLTQFKDELLGRLYRACGGKITVELELYFKTLGESSTLAALMTKGMPIIPSSDGEFCTCTEVGIKVTRQMTKYYHAYPFGDMLASSNIILNVDDDVELFSDAAFQDDIPRKILASEVESDFEIMASDGAIIKCHKNFLAANSPVLGAMLSTNMTEKNANRMLMDDVSEEGVRAFLLYLYCNDTTEPKRDLELAFELLQLGHKYEVKRLERNMIKMLDDKPDIYFTAELARDMFLFVRNMPGGERLKEKMIRILNIENPLWKVELDRLCQGNNAIIKSKELLTESYLEDIPEDPEVEEIEID